MVGSTGDREGEKTMMGLLLSASFFGDVSDCGEGNAEKVAGKVTLETLGVPEIVFVTWSSIS